MLRRRLMKIFFCQTVMLVVLAVVALWLLNDVFRRLDALYERSQWITQQSNELNHAISTIQVELYALQSGRTQRLDALVVGFEQMRDVVRNLNDQAPSDDERAGASYLELVRHVDAFESQAAALATWQDPRSVGQKNLAALDLAARLRVTAIRVTDRVHGRMQQEQIAMLARFRTLVIGLAVGFLLVVNASIVLVIRASVMVLRPVDRLLKASQEWAGEHFDHRVDLGHRDEFGELGAAFNRLAEQLDQNEKHRFETLGQAALMLNHELNNAMSIIELQLSVMRRKMDKGSDLEHSLHEIHTSLQRMSRVIEALKHVRRIVLTDYVSGVKMLDLGRSVRDDVPGVATPVSPEQHRA